MQSNQRFNLLLAATILISCNSTDQIKTESKDSTVAHPTSNNVAMSEIIALTLIRL